MKSYIDFINEHNENMFEDNREIVYDFLRLKMEERFKDYKMMNYNLMSDNWAKNNIEDYNTSNYDVHILMYYTDYIPYEKDIKKLLDKYFKDYKLTINTYTETNSVQSVISFNLEETFNSNIFKSIKSINKFNL